MNFQPINSVFECLRLIISVVFCYCFVIRNMDWKYIIMTPWGLARVEVIVSKKHIASELKRGVPVKQIHGALVCSGRVSVTYNSFRRQIISIRDELNTVVTNSGPVDIQTVSSNANKQKRKQVPIVKNDDKPSEEFVFDPSCKAEDFF